MYITSRPLGQMRAVAHEVPGSSTSVYAVFGPVISSLFISLTFFTSITSSILFAPFTMFTSFFTLYASSTPFTISTSMALSSHTASMMPRAAPSGTQASTNLRRPSTCWQILSQSSRSRSRELKKDSVTVSNALIQSQLATPSCLLETRNTHRIFLSWNSDNVLDSGRMVSLMMSRGINCRRIFTTYASGQSWKTKRYN